MLDQNRTYLWKKIVSLVVRTEKGRKRTKPIGRYIFFPSLFLFAHNCNNTFGSRTVSVLPSCCLEKVVKNIDILRYFTHSYQFLKTILMVVNHTQDTPSVVKPWKSILRFFYFLEQQVLTVPEHVVCKIVQLSKIIALFAPQRLSLLLLFRETANMADGTSCRQKGISL